MHDLEREVGDQPALLRRLAQELGPALVEWRRRVRPRRLVLSGCGDMAFAARAAAAWGAGIRGTPVVAWPAMDLRWYADRLGPEDGVVLASISGRTPRTREALRLAQARGCATLVLTDDPGAPLAEEAGQVLVLGTAGVEELRRHQYAGYSSEAPQTRTFLAVLLLELLLADGTPAPAWSAQVPTLLADASADQRIQAQRFAQDLAGDGALQRVHVLGSGPFLPVAAYGAAKLLEYAIHATPQCLEEFHHLEMFTVGPGTGVVALAPDPVSRQRWEEVQGVPAALGGRAVGWTLGTGLDCDPAAALPAALFLAAQALQWQAFELARVLGRDLDRWVGGVRRDLIFRLSASAVRDSRLWSGGATPGDAAG